MSASGGGPPAARGGPRGRGTRVPLFPRDFRWRKGGAGEVQEARAGSTGCSRPPPSPRDPASGAAATCEATVLARVSRSGADPWRSVRDRGGAAPAGDDGADPWRDGPCPRPRRGSEAARPLQVMAARIRGPCSGGTASGGRATVVASTTARSWRRRDLARS